LNRLFRMAERANDVVNQVVLVHLAKQTVSFPCLGEVIGEVDLPVHHPALQMARLHRSGWRLMRLAASQDVGFVVDGATAVRCILHRPIPLVVVDWRPGPVDRQLQVVGAQAVALGVSIGEDPALQQLMTPTTRSWFIVHCLPKRGLTGTPQAIPAVPAVHYCQAARIRRPSFRIFTAAFWSRS